MAGRYIDRNHNLLKSDPGVLEDINSSYVPRQFNRKKTFQDLEQKNIELEFAVGKSKDKLCINKKGTGMHVRTH